MKISIASYSFHGLLAERKMDAFGYMESCRYRYHLGAADFWNGIIGSADEDYIRKVRQGMDERGLVCANYHVDGPHVWDNDPAVREKNYKNAMMHLGLAEILGAQTIRFDTGGTETVLTQEQLDTLVKRYREYAHRAAQFGARCGPETHWGFSLLADNMVKIAESVDHPGYGILLHLGHFVQGSEEDGDRRLARWACHTHVDAKITWTCLEKRMRILLDAGYKGYWGVEHHTGKNEYHEVAAQIGQVRRTLALIGKA